MTRAKPARIDRSLFEMIEDLRKQKCKETGLEVSFPQASRLFAENIVKKRMKRPLNNKQKKLLDL